MRKLPLYIIPLALFFLTSAAPLYYAEAQTSTLGSDTFNGANNTFLQDHTSDSSHTWVKHPSYTGNAIISANAAKDQYGNAPVYYLNAVPATAEYDVQLDVTGIDDVMGPAGRIDIVADTHYSVYWSKPVGNWRIYKTVNGVSAVLGTYAGDSPSGVIRTLKLEIRDAAKKLFINGIQRISSSDNSITGVGRAGIAFSGYPSDTGDNFSVVNIGGATPTPSDTAPPSVPAGLTASAVSTSQISLSWIASTDNVGVTGYNVYRNGTQIASVAATSYNNTGLTASTAYSYTVAAYDAAGYTSVQSTSVSAATQSATPPPIPAPTVTLSASPTSVTSGSSATLSWSSTNATSCTASGLPVAATQAGGWSGAKIVSGSQSITGITTTGTYALSCTGSGGTASQSVTITVTSVPSPTTPGIFYISPSGNDTNSGTTSGAPFKTFSKAFSVIAGGDELILLDGVYGTAQGTGYISYLGSGSAQPPSGTSVSNQTVVRAQNPGNVTVNGSLFIGRSTRKDSYIKIQGITFEGGGSLYNTSFVTVKDSGFHGSFGVGTNDHSNGNTNNLIEDVWVWASGSRIIAINYRADRNVWRRVIVRGDGCGTAGCSGSGNPNVGVTVYNSRDVSFQNVMVADRILSGTDSPYGDFATAQHDPGGGLPPAADYFGRNEWLGPMSVNSPDTAFYFEADTVLAGELSWTIRNALAVRPNGVGINIGLPYNGTTPNMVDGVTVVGAGSDGVRLAPGQSGSTVRNIISANSGRYGVNSASTPAYVDVYNSLGGVYNQTTCNTGCRTTNPQGDGATPSLLYPVRVEQGSALKGAGSSGADIGANIVTRYGIDGTRFGEAGYNTPTGTNLWPWPNEARIKTEMCTNTTRGFCGTGKRLDGVNNVTLSSYIWEVLGNPVPSSVYSGTTTPPPTSTPTPTVSFSASPTSITSGSGVTLSWSSTNATSCTASGGWTGTKAISGSQTLTNLTTTGTYTLSCTGSGGTTSQSVTVNVTGTTPPSSTKFSLNDRVQVSSGPLNVRATASATGTLLGTQATGVLGTVIGGPIASGGFNWWNINYDSGVDGWSAEDFLVKYIAPTTSLSCSATNMRCVDDTAGSTQEYGTIQAAVTAAVAGDTVLVYGGTYRGFIASKSGTATSRITIKTTGETVTINQTNTNNEGITISNASYITIEGFTVAGMPSYGFATHGASATNPMRGLIIKNNTVQNSGFVNLYASNTADSTIEGNVTSGSGTSHGIYVANGGSDNVIIRGNRAFNNAKNGIHFNGDLSVGGDGYHTGLTVENNIIYNNTSNGFDVDGVGDSTFQNNLAYGNGTNAFRAFQIDAGTGIRNLKIMNNTFITPGGGVPIKITEDLGGHAIFNNILIAGGSNGSLVTSNANFKSANNAVNGTFSSNGGNTLASLASWQGSGYDANSFTTTGAALFTSSTANDYTLKAGSPAIDKGASIFNGASAPTADILGASRQSLAYDIGAYEYASGGTTPPPTPAPTCTTFTYSAWGSCQSNNTQSRTTTASSPQGCTGGTPILSQSCIYTPPVTTPPPGTGGGRGTSSGGGTTTGGTTTSSGTTSGTTATSGAPASGLTNAQIQAILSLLSSFGADSATIARISAILTGTTLPTTTTTSVSFQTNLYFGIKSGDVTKLQQLLAQDPSVYPEGLVTGYYGFLTVKAVQRFQAKYKIVSSGTAVTTGYGVAGPKTRAKLNELAGK